MRLQEGEGVIVADTKEKGQTWWKSLSRSEQEAYQRKKNVQWFNGLSVKQQGFIKLQIQNQQTDWLSIQ